MIKNSYRVIGVMSGTSLDGIDLVYATFRYDKQWCFNILNADTIPYTSTWKLALKDLVQKDIEALKIIDAEYTNYLANIVKQFIEKHKITEVDAVCSHGHTALHQPENKLTYQIGNLPELASIIGCNVVCDFRVQDVELGGQGAPLVPIGDALLFSNYTYCLNFGGFANISTQVDNKRVAFDVCPVNIVLNHYVKTLGLDFDDKGQLASKGTVNYNLLNKLNALAFYNLQAPKSLGLEWVNTHVLPLIDASEKSIKNILRTFVEHIAIQVSKVVKNSSASNVLLTGGGAYNTFLLSRVQGFTNAEIIIPSKDIIEFKEALIFGFLGVLKLQGQNNCLKSVTGAKKDHSSGKIYLS